MLSERFLSGGNGATMVCKGGTFVCVVMGLAGASASKIQLAAAAHYVVPSICLLCVCVRSGRMFHDIP